VRPLRLEVEGFTVFRTPTVVDFASADLFALVGPTGAGKTSVIDAITFALYGSVPRLDDRRAVAPVVSQNLNEARVRLDFTVHGELHTAVRVVRATKSGGATTKEARLQRGDEVLAGTADEVTAAVTDLLGLTFEHFTTCVSLPQGQFARFLHDKPRSRQDLLVRLLDLGLYDLVASAARQRGALARSRAEVVAGQLERLADATPEARAAAERRVTELAQLLDRLAGERPAVDRLAAAAAEAQARADEVAGRLDRLARLAAPAGVDEQAAALATAERDRSRAAELDDEAVALVADAEQGLAGLPARASLEAVRSDHARRGELAGLVERGAEAESEAASRLADAESADAAARAEVAERAADLERVRVELRAQALVPELVVGEPCPVCGHDVADLPAGHHAPDLERAERAVAAADKAATAAGRALAEARTHQARVDEKLVRVRADLAEVEQRLAQALDPEAVESQLALVTEAETALDKARQAERDARRARSDADRRHAALVDQERDARRAFDAARDAVAALGPPAAERRDLAADWQALLRWAGERRPELESEADGHRAQAAEARAGARQRLDAVVDECRAAGVEVTARVGARALSLVGGGRSAGSGGTGGIGGIGGTGSGGSGDTSFDAALAAWPGESVAAAHARAEEAVGRIDAQIADAERLRSDAAAATEQHQVADALAGHLAANRFEKWLLDEAVHQLVAGASEILDELSGGAHALAVDGRTGGFMVVDHANASQVRPARTLSGGETFLASLALALALADQVAGLAAAGTARLEALFLDEGFGTLDPDTLDVVATALDELGARGRMVGIVTHVRELAERLPVRFEVRKVGASAGVERVEA
jgi:exonuclease SbcC